MTRFRLLKFESFFEYLEILRDIFLSCCKLDKKRLSTVSATTGLSYLFIYFLLQFFRYEVLALALVCWIHSIISQFISQWADLPHFTNLKMLANIYGLIYTNLYFLFYSKSPFVNIFQILEGLILAVFVSVYAKNTPKTRFFESKSCS